MNRPDDELDGSLRSLVEREQPDTGLEPYSEALDRLRSLEPVPEREPHVVAAGRKAFLDQAAAAPVSRTAPPRHTVRTHGGRKEWQPMQALLGLLVTVAMLFGGGGVTAYAAQDALPTDWLYPVKLATEDLQFRLTADPADQVDLLSEWIDRRFQEMHDLTRAGEAVPLEANDRLERQLGLVLQTAAQVGDPEMTQLLQRLQSRLQTHLATMQQLRSADPQGAALQAAEQAMLQTQAEIRGALEDPAAFRTRYGAGRPETAPEQPEVTPGEPGQGSGQGDGQGSGQGQGTGEGQNPDAGQGAGSQGGVGPGDGTCECTAQGDGTLACSAACLPYLHQHQYAGSQGAGNGYGIASANCSCTPQADGSLVCPETCDPRLFLWSTPGPNGFGSGAGRSN